ARTAPPRRLGSVLGGNGRWAGAPGTPAWHGHRRGADKIADLLGWSEEAGVETVTLWMLSTDNLHRDSDEVAELLEIIAGAVDTLDRKSTRLNSSHVKISYAVFCLKKKKTTR